ncbi:unnamed protein product [marine sediment metagenome]|uniref:Uncharacterized protein n=1 Tax=marine sediment metagenome TaxID=412755 RepID=X1RI44_9ZZZZ
MNETQIVHDSYQFPLYIYSRIKIKAKKVIKFKPGKALTEKVK